MRLLPRSLAIAVVIAAGGASIATAFAASPVGLVPGLRDAELEAAIGQSLTLNPLISAKRGEVAAARQDLNGARLQYAPTLSTQLQGGSGASTQYASALRADQKLYTGGRIAADVRAASAQRDSAVLGVQETALSVALQIASAWQALQAAHGQRRAVESYRLRLDAYALMIARRIDSGVSPRAEQDLVSARRAQSGIDLAAAQAATRSAQATLKRLAGVEFADDAGAPLPGDESELPAAPPVCQTDAVLDSALDRHPSMRRSADDIEAARAALDSQRAGAKPTVTLRLEQPMGEQLPGVPRGARLSLVLEYSSDASLSGRAHADAAAERLVALSDQALAQRHDLAQQVRTECADLDGIALRATGYLRGRSLTSDVMDSYERLFAAGKRGWVDVLNAAREDFENEQGALVALAGLRAAHYRIALLDGDYALDLPQPEDEPAPARFPWLRTAAR